MAKTTDPAPPPVGPTDPAATITGTRWSDRAAFLVWQIALGAILAFAAIHYLSLWFRRA